MNLNPGLSSKRFHQLWYFYVGIQVLLLAKVLIFFLFFGKGISYTGQPVWLNIPFIAVPVFGNIVHVAEYVFHQFVHVAIFFWVFALARELKDVRWGKMILLYLVAVTLHNVGYWLTASHPSLLYSMRDFATDFIALWGFFFLSRWAFRHLPVLKKMRIPLLENA